MAPSPPEAVPPGKKRWGRGKRVLFWSVLVGLPVVLLVAGGYLVSICQLSSEQWTWSHTLAAALSGGRSVTFVEFVPHYFDPDADKLVPHEVILQRTVATPAQIQELRRATSGFLVLDPVIRAAGCYEPHHRVEIVRADGSAWRFEVCLSCRKIRLDGAFDEPMPASWLVPLRQVLKDVGMPQRTDGEYEALAEKKATANGG